MDRPAASVTLDTIIAPLLLQLIKDWPDNESDAEFAKRSAEAVTDALLAKGRLVAISETDFVYPMPCAIDEDRCGLLIPLEAS